MLMRIHPKEFHLQLHGKLLEGRTSISVNQASVLKAYCVVHWAEFLPYWLAVGLGQLLKGS